MTSNYRPLPQTSPLDEDVEERSKTKSLDFKHLKQRSNLPLLLVILILILFVSLSLNVLLIPRSSPKAGCDCSPKTPVTAWNDLEPLYSPAQDAVRYERRVFTQLGVRTKYHGPPTNETDEAWDSLYNMGISRITSSEAALLPNRTESIPEEEGVSVISLDVFHQLHCLNNIRQALWPERYGVPELIPSLIKGDPTPFDHVDHCVNILRENIMCNADVTPDVWQWDEDKQMSFPRFDVVHTCRNWEAIIDWAKARQMNYVWDMSIHVGHEHDHRPPIG